MNRNSINFDNKNIKKRKFYNKDIKIFNILMLIIYQSLKKNNTANIIHLNTLLGIMIMILLDHYIYLFHKLLDILISLKKNEIAMQQYKDSIITNLYNKKIPEERVQHKCLSIIILESVLYAYEKYYPQTFLEECKYAKEKIKTNNYIDAELESESDIDTDIDNEEIRQ